MNAFKNLKIGVKILAGYVIALVLMLAIGGVALVQLGQLDSTVDDLTTNLAQERQLANDIAVQIMRVRLHATRFVNNHRQDILDKYQLEMNSLDAALLQADEAISNPKRVTVLTQIETDVATYKQTFAEMVDIIAERDQVQVDVLDVQGPLALDKLDALGAAAQASNDSTISFQVGMARRAFLLMRLDAFKYLVEGDPELAQKFDERYQEAQEAFAQLETDLQDPAQRQLYTDAQTAVEAYALGFQTLQADFVHQRDLQTGTLDVLGPQIRENAATIVESVGEDFVAESRATDELVAQTRTILLVTMAVAVLAGLGLGILISRAITVPLAQVARAATGITEGHLDQLVTVQSRDEVGQMAEAFRTMIGYLKEVAGVADQLATGDLTVDVKLRSEGDQLGKSLHTMVD